MKQQELAHLTDEELVQEQKKIKSSNIVNAFLIGISIGIAVYSTAKNGFGFFALLPLFFAFVAFNNGKKITALKKELKSRNLE